MAPAKTSRVRLRVLAFGLGLGGLTYMDRVCIGTMAGDIMRDLSLNEVQMGFVFSAFTLAYSIFEVPTAWWAQRVGTRRVLTRIVAWWSTFTVLTAMAFNYWVLLTLRFLFGVGEAGAFPCMARAFHGWFPAVERGTVQGTFFAGGHLIGGLTPLLVTAMLHVLSWRAILVIFGMMGFLWVWGWWRFYRDDPATHPSMTAAELRHIQSGRQPEESHDPRGVPWGQLLRNRSIVALCLLYGTQGYGFYFYITWLPTYLKENRGFGDLTLGLLAGLPLLLSVVADLVGGVATDRLSRRFGLRAGRATVGGAAFLAAGVALIAGTAIQNGLVSAILIAVAACGPHFALGASWGCCLDIGGKNSGVVSACMNTSGQLAGVLSPVVLGFILHRFSNWSAPLYLTGVLYLLGAMCWAVVDPGRPLKSASGEEGAGVTAAAATGD